MKALPTMTPSAPALIIRFTCSGFEIPNPTANGIFPDVKGKTRLTSSIVESSTFDLCACNAKMGNKIQKT